MYVRIATFEGVDVDASAPSFERAQEVMRPFFERLTGFKGYLDLGDRSAGKALSLYFFDTEENMQAAEQPLDEELPRVLGPEIMEGFTGRRTSVERFEVLAQEGVSVSG